jgi:hypothetical protein
MHGTIPRATRRRERTAPSSDAATEPVAIHVDESLAAAIARGEGRRC